MGWTALRTFPGQAATHGFDNSNGYDRVLAAAAREAALGWTVRDGLDGSRPVITLADRTGAPLAGARLEASVMRPIGETAPAPTGLSPPSPPGRYEADAALAPGRDGTST